MSFQWESPATRRRFWKELTTILISWETRSGFESSQTFEENGHCFKHCSREVQAGAGEGYRRRESNDRKNDLSHALLDTSMSVHPMAAAR